MKICEILEQDVLSVVKQGVMTSSTLHNIYRLGQAWPSIEVFQSMTGSRPHQQVATPLTHQFQDGSLMSMVCWHELVDSHLVLQESPLHSSLQIGHTAKMRRTMLWNCFPWHSPTEEMEDQHDLGIFVRLGRTYCTSCIAGRSNCRHLMQVMWYQYHRWTDQRFGLDFF